MVKFTYSFVPTAPMIVLDFSDEKLTVQFGGLGRSLFWPAAGGFSIASGLGIVTAASKKGGFIDEGREEGRELVRKLAYGVGAGFITTGLYTAWVGSICNRWSFDKTSGKATHQQAAFFRPWSKAVPVTYEMSSLKVSFITRESLKLKSVLTKGADGIVTSEVVEGESTARICLVDRSGSRKPMHLDSRAPDSIRDAMPWPTRNLLSNAFFLSDFLAFDWKKVSATTLSADEERAATDLFNTVDFNKNGFLDGRELRRFAQSMPDNCRKVLGADESRLATVEGKSTSLSEAVFLQQIVVEGSVTGVGKLSDHMQVLDANRDGRISKEEFLRWIKLRSMSRTEQEAPVSEMCRAWKDSYLKSIPFYANVPIISSLFW
eukprot:TRINITY_DN95719_c0_g1_i1.p1 TRINITY_DN95719_c0_g1~~TRINITY_DN95719_c0_g1_i1.p1  ORF type:complete len:388 (+),score=72.24 TRINITY_DN95719_c0_g1_i1:39-1166(+)